MRITYTKQINCCDDHSLHLMNYLVRCLVNEMMPEITASKSIFPFYSMGHWSCCIFYFFLFSFFFGGNKNETWNSHCDINCQLSTFDCNVFTRFHLFVTVYFTGGFFFCSATSFRLDPSIFRPLQFNSFLCVFILWLFFI